MGEEKSGLPDEFIQALGLIVIKFAYLEYEKRDIL